MYTVRIDTCVLASAGIALIWVNPTPMGKTSVQSARDKFSVLIKHGF